MKLITVAAAIILNDHGEMLLVRKKGTDYFMQVGGKLEENEQPQEALLREIQEEIGVSAEIIQDFGLIKTQAANEAGHQLHAYVFHVQLHDTPVALAELAELRWIHPTQAQQLLLAPLTEQFVLPVIARLNPAIMV
ncbi:NUDIX domain-containing protein [Acinetobacter sp. MD2(2019)]|uniref:NUDIX hydrolase n=1 Tax=Acinetobacter sp. MD2(2019) TaxID=2605273 RepID=UPI002D1E8447|nr:NUDIX domain-containing protein [Acinetobacter sp. MD2(2019)]MEB3753643.1 NUDIX domain-containing protein [Acinetobacter sp. MD2(2019)]